MQETNRREFIGGLLAGGALLASANLPAQDDPSLFPKRGKYERLKREPLLKAILAGHLHITIQEQFSPTAVQYLVGGNFAFQGREILID